MLGYRGGVTNVLGFDALRLELNTSPELHALRDEAATSAKGKEWRVQDGLIIIKGRVYLPATSPCLQEPLIATDGTGHEGIAKTLH
jgi:hypothetical protein